VIDEQKTKETASWLAVLQGGSLKRQVAKQIIQRWCLEEERPLAAAFRRPDPELAQELGLSADQLAQLRRAEAQISEQVTLLQGLAGQGIGVLLRNDAAYPESLAHHLPEERLPYLLFYRGELGLLTQPTVGVLGSAAPSVQAQHVATDLARRLAEREQTLVGGYARGIERLVLDAARQERGCTVLVLPMGLRLFGQSHLDIERALREGRALLLSPFPVDAEASEAAALARIPLVAGLCDMIVLIEPDAAPSGWPALEMARAAELPVCVWRGLNPAQIEAWLAAGAAPFEDCPSGMVLVDRSMGLGADENAPPAAEIAPSVGADEPSQAEPLPFDDAESAIKSLERSGRVPEVLARRLRETRWR